MTAHINFFPLGNADTLRLDLADGRKVLVDYAAVRNGDDNEDKRCNLPAELRRDLKKVGRDFFDSVCITHIDSDHCKGFGEFFWLEHAAKYQDGERIKIKELWVPAAAVLEEGVKVDARLVRAEARHRLREGKGVRVFSRPDALKKWFEDEGLDFEELKHLIVDAGQLVPGYSKTGPEKVEFFVHCPFAWRQDENSVISRNEDSIAMHATFLEGGRESRLFMASDINHETLAEIVKVMAERGQDGAVEIAQRRLHRGRLPRRRAPLDVFGGEFRQRRAGSGKGHGTSAALLVREEGERGGPRLVGLHRVRLAERDPARLAVAPEAEHPGPRAVGLDAEHEALQGGTRPTHTRTGGCRSIAARPGERFIVGRCRGEVDGKNTGDLGPALALRCLALDRRSGQKGIEADRGQCRLPAENVGQAVARN